MGIQIGGIYGLLRPDFDQQDTYTVEVIEIMEKTKGHLDIPLKCRSLQTSEEFYTFGSDLGDFGRVRESYEDSLLKLKYKEEEKLNMKLCGRIKIIYELMLQSRATPMLSWLDTEVEITNDDIALMGDILDLCLDQRNQELFDKASNLKSKLNLHLTDCQIK